MRKHTVFVQCNRSAQNNARAWTSGSQISDMTLNIFSVYIKPIYSFQLISGQTRKKSQPTEQVDITKEKPVITLQRRQELDTYSVAKKRRILRGLIAVNRLNLLFLPSPESIRIGVQGVQCGATRGLFWTRGCSSWDGTTAENQIQQKHKYQ